jgi:hypothetical protein
MSQAQLGLFGAAVPIPTYKLNSCRCGCGARVKGIWRKGHHRRGVSPRNKKHRTPEQIRQKAKTWRDKNLAKIHQWQAEWRRLNPDKMKAVAERRKLRRYGLTVEQYLQLLAAQSGLCAICLEPERKGRSIKSHRAGKPFTQEKGRLAIDHCHHSQQVRGLLCGNCNAVLGHAKDSIEILKAAITYLERYK